MSVGRALIWDMDGTLPADLVVQSLELLEPNAFERLLQDQRCPVTN